MLSYRHGFHAGNHADVLKHFIWVQLLLHLTKKDKPLWVIDTLAASPSFVPSARASSASLRSSPIAFSGINIVAVACRPGTRSSIFESR